MTCLVVQSVSTAKVRSPLLRAGSGPALQLGGCRVPMNGDAEPLHDCCGAIVSIVWLGSTPSAHGLAYYLKLDTRHVKQAKRRWQSKGAWEEIDRGIVIQCHVEVDFLYVI